MIPVTIPLIQNLGIEIRRAKNFHKIPSIVMVTVAVLNFFISIPLIKIWGAIGAALGTFIGLFVNTVYINIYYYKKCGLDIPFFWRRMFKLLFFTVLAGVIGTVIKRFVGTENIKKLILAIMIYIMVYCMIVGIFGTDKDEKQLIKSFIKRRNKK